MNTNAYNILKSHKVTRLCHFTRFQSLTSILSSENGIIASKLIQKDVKNVTDNKRLDGKADHICCTIEYPNSWYFQTARKNNNDKIFIDWVVLYINIEILKNRSIEFCPCNASKGCGRYIQKNSDNIGILFTDFDGKYYRTNEMLSCCPTNGQAEILIYGNIPSSYIMGAAVADKDLAKRVNAYFKTIGIDCIPIYIAPSIFTVEWSRLVHEGQRPDETIWSQED